MREDDREAGGDKVSCGWATYIDTLEAHRKLTSSKRRVLFQTKTSTVTFKQNNTLCISYGLHTCTLRAAKL